MSTRETRTALVHDLLKERILILDGAMKSRKGSPISRPRQ